MRKYTIALAQMDSREDKAKNLACAGRFVDEAAARGAKLVAFPEIFDVIDFGEEPPETLPDGPAIRLMREKARAHGIWIHCGSIFTQNPDGDRKSNTTVLLDPAGEIRATYDKLHLFDITLPNGQEQRESKRVRPGARIVTAETELGVLGFSICYDIRFPELYRALALKGAQVIFVPAEFSIFTGKDHWEALLRARAIENGCYIVAPAQIGTKNKRFPCFGASMVVDPWGTVVARARDEAGIILAEIDLDYLDRVRRNIPSLEHRRTDVYDLTWKESD